MKTFRKLYQMLSKKERRQVFWILPMITFMALLQVVGIASISPFLLLISNPDIIETNQILSWTYQTFGFGSDQSFLIFTGVAAVLVIALSNGFTAFTMWTLLQFSWGLYHSLSRRLLSIYLAKPYPFFLNRNTADLGKNILSEVSQMVRGALVPAMRLIARGVVALFILVTLVFVDPLVAGSAFVLFGGAYGLAFFIARRRLSRYGQMRVDSNRVRFHAAAEALAGVKEVQLMGKEQAFIDRYAEPSSRYTFATAAEQVVKTIPRYFLEAIAFGGIVLLAIYFIAIGRDPVAFVPLLGLYVLALYRLMPALQEVFASASAIRANMASVDTVYRDLQNAVNPEFVDRNAIEALSFEKSIELKDISFQYPETDSPVLHDFSLSIEANTSVAFVGSTGSGKTTTVDLILGLLKAQQGQLSIDGVEVNETNLDNWQKNLGYVPQVIYLNDDTVASNIAFGVPKDAIDMSAVTKAAKLANIHDFIENDMPEGYDTFVGERGIRLSGGQRQRLGIARALYHNPQVLILDEATSALDGVTEEYIFNAVNEIGKSKTVIMIAHRISTVRECNVIYLLDQGQVKAHGSYDELMRTSPEFRAIAQVDPRQVVELS